MGKKKKNKDFQKVKLKAGRKISKGDNVTDTSFKAKKIVVNQRLKSTGGDHDETAAAAHVPIDELLIRLHHYSVPIRLDSLRGLITLLNRHNDLAEKHLSSLLEKVPLLATDVDENIRKATLSVMKLVLGNVSKSKLMSMYSILAAQLCCSMSHLNSNIQFDSLFFLDVLLENCPDILAEYSAILLPNFINLISKHKTSQNNKSRFLTVDPSNRLMSHSWIRNVLMRMNKVLKVLVKPEASTDIIGNQVCWPICHQKSIHTFSQSEALPQFSVKEITKQVEQKDSNRPNYGITEFLFDIIPLLFETWVEIFPRSRVSNELNDPDLFILEIILDSFVQALTFVKSSRHNDMLAMIYDLMSKNFVDLIVCSFPYSYLSSGYRKRKRNQDGPQKLSSEICNEVNLMICYVMLSLPVGNSSLDNIYGYLNNFLNSTCLTSTKQTELVIAILNMLIEQKYKHVDELLVTLYSVLENNSYSSHIYRAILLSFQKIFWNSSNKSFGYLHKCVLEFIANEVQKTGNAFDEDTLAIYVGLIGSSLKQYPSATSSIIKPCLSELIRHLHGGMKHENVKSVCNLFYWCDFGKEFLDVIIRLKRELPKNFLITFIKLTSIRHGNGQLPVSTEN